MTVIQFPMNKIYDKCVSCEILTDVRRETPVDQRRFYVEGAGQLCFTCYGETYTPENLAKTDAWAEAFFAEIKRMER